ncbi:MAG: dihydrofolate reductase [Elusimicrobia bacterium]|nr:dihydrofolate reductase [Elusimicrobiota bacterium]MDE2237920.1 dihydrofolate reductase [Elusimicrobiota bacterium]MDE2426817.1 dihydrofolate reductase [Elusimicrobiota bacterium]
MRKLGVFNLMTLDGYITGERGDISWHEAVFVNGEFQKYAERNSNAGGTLLFGRKTYELMAGYWPTAEALKNDPIVAGGMNAATKIVFSRTLKKAGWSNTRLVKSGLLAEVRRLKAGSGKGLTILGSGSLVSQLAPAGLIDEYQLMVVPVALGRGKTMFEGLKKRLKLKLKSTKAFRNGSVLLVYSKA